MTSRSSHELRLFGFASETPRSTGPIHFPCASPVALALEFAGLHCPGGAAAKVASSGARVPLGWPARLLCRGVKLKQRLVSGLLLAASAILFLTLVRITGVRQAPFASPAQGWVPSHRKGVAGPSAQQASSKRF
ncbi:hypothetical protein HPB49_000735 [Dermacentor silvarum]|uniref:Uncharacterized protein n=1 Tax=Dermacentor silvarum TaxID=543639 RepID=A0ACB8CNZ2_DERSI|nr:hypothetical protein HPB49_000735 [Dermacentor silvarum]